MNRVYDPASFAYLDGTGESAWNSYEASAVHFRFNGAPTLTGSYYVIGRICHAQIKVDPATGLSTYAASSFVTLPISSYGFGGLATAYGHGTNVSVTAAGVVCSTSVVRLGDFGPIIVPLLIYAIYQI